jgi:lysine 2,3-aminomutase
MQLETNNNKPKILSWGDDFRSSLKNLEDINKFFNLKLESISNYKVFLPISFAHKIKAAGLNSALAKQFIPCKDENAISGLLDPIGDKVKGVSDGIIHRYKNRILFTPTTICPIICRYCFRKNELSNNDEIYQHKLSSLKSYLLDNPQINEVILTGGDPLIVSDQKLDQIFTLLSNLNIKFLRIHTRTPIILPKRIDDSFIRLLQKFEDKFTKIIFSLHVNHLDELDHEVELALHKLRRVRIDKKTQTVLLRDINDNAKALTDLFYKLIDLDFNPYYLHHPDKVRGAMHFYLSLEEGRQIYSKLRKRLPGWALPHYVIDQYQGRGKQLAFNPEGFSYSGKMLDINGELVQY